MCKISASSGACCALECCMILSLALNVFSLLLLVVVATRSMKQQGAHDRALEWETGPAAEALEKFKKDTIHAGILAKVGCCVFAPGDLARTGQHAYQAF